jgi:hypothetical protein
VWNDDDYDVLDDSTVVGRILKVHAAPVCGRWIFGTTKIARARLRSNMRGRDGGVRQELAEGVTRGARKPGKSFAQTDNVQARRPD